MSVVTNRGQRIQFQPNATGGFTLIQPTDQQYRLDAIGGTLRFTNPGSRRVHVFDSSTLLLSQILDEHGNTLSLTYTGGLLAQVSDGLGRAIMFSGVTSVAYDPASGYPGTLTLADGSLINWGYSSHAVGGTTMFDLATAAYPDGTTESYGRDATGNLTDFTDRGGFPWQATYNSRGQPLTFTNPSLGVTTFTYDTQGRLTTAQDDAGNTTQFGYDGLSRLTRANGRECQRSRSLSTYGPARIRTAPAWESL